MNVHASMLVVNRTLSSWHTIQLQNGADEREENEAQNFYKCAKAVILLIAWWIKWGVSQIGVIRWLMAKSLHVDMHLMLFAILLEVLKNFTVTTWQVLAFSL